MDNDNDPDNDLDDDLDMDKEENTVSNVPALSLQDLMSPRPNGHDQVFSPIPMECRASAETLYVSNLLPQLETIRVDKHEEIRENESDDISMGSDAHYVMDLDDQKDVSQDFYHQNTMNTSNIELERAIQSAIQRRRTSEPRFVMNQLSTNQKVTPSITKPQDMVTSIPMKEISRVHRFIHFQVETEKMDMVDDDTVKQQCSELLDVYTSKLNSTDSEGIQCQTVHYNEVTNQCTLYMNVFCQQQHGNQWTRSFLAVLDSFCESVGVIPVHRKSIVFDQLLPL